MSYSKFFMVTRTEDGGPVENAAVAVYDAGGIGVPASLANIYQDEYGATPIAASTIYSASDGYVEFYAAAGNYDMRTTKLGHTFRDLLNVPVGYEAVLTPTATEWVKTARIMWHAVNVIYVVPTVTDMQRMVNTYYANVLHLPDAEVLPAATITDYLNLAAQWGCKVILGCGSTNAATIATFVNAWAGYDTVIAFSTAELGDDTVAGQLHLEAYATSKPLLLEFEYQKPGIPLELLVDPTAPLFAVVTFDYLFYDDCALHLYDAIDPPGQGSCILSTMMNLHAGRWPHTPIIPAIVATANNAGGVIDTDWMPTAAEQVRLFAMLGIGVLQGVVIDRWGPSANVPLVGLKVGIEDILDTDARLVDLRLAVTSVMEGAAQLPALHSAGVSYEQATQRWHDNLLLNYMLLPTASNRSVPYLWEIVDATAPGTPLGTYFDITHDLANQNALIKVAPSATYVESTAHFFCLAEVPAWLANQLAGQPITARVLGWAEPIVGEEDDWHARIRVRQYDAKPEPISALATLGSSQWEDLTLNNRTTVAMAPIDSTTRFVLFQLQLRNATLYLNDLWMGLGAPVEGIGHSLANKFVKTGAIVDWFLMPAVDNDYSRSGPAPMYLSCGAFQLDLLAATTAAHTVVFPNPVFDMSADPDSTDELPQKRVAAHVSFLLRTEPTAIAFTPDELSCVFTQAADDGKSVTLYIKNANADPLDVIAFITLYMVPSAFPTAI